MPTQPTSPETKLSDDVAYGTHEPGYAHQPRGKPRITALVHLAVLVVMIFGGAASPLLAQPVETRFIRIPLVFKYGLPFTAATINGQRFNLVIDLGGYAAIALTPSALARTEALFHKGTERYISATGVTAGTRGFTIADVSLGPQALGPLKGSELFTGPSGADGTLGLDLLKRYVVVFDYAKSEMRLYAVGNRTALLAECGPSAFDLTVDENGVTSMLETERGQMHIGWDTGASANVIRPSALNENAKIDQAFWPWQSPSVTLMHPSLGEQRLEAIRFQLQDFQQPDVDGFLGYDFFLTHRVCFDFAGKKAGLRLNTSTAATVAP